MEVYQAGYRKTLKAAGVTTDQIAEFAEGQRGRSAYANHSGK